MSSAKLSDREAMLMAIQEAKRGEGFVSPNPLVGCVILNSKGELLAKGFHSAVGRDHAEVDAIKKVEDPSFLKEAQVFVTLEPCAHEGRTPSCAKALAQLPIHRLVYGLKDPNPLVSGKGAQILKDASKQVELFEGLEEELEELAEVFLMNMRNRRAFVSLKIASSLDGRVALSSGESQWITTPSSRERVQWLRGLYDAVLVGIGTYKSDNPSLDIRHPHFSEKSNKVVLIDPKGESLRNLSESNMCKAHQNADIYIALNWKLRSQFSDEELARECEALSHTALEAPTGWQDRITGINYIFPKLLADNRLDFIDLSEKLFEKGICSILCEGGSRVFSRFLQQGAADRLILFQNTSVFGEGMSWGSGFEIKNLNRRIRLQNPKFESFGDDVMIQGQLRY